jgi:hypothetical protein
MENNLKCWRGCGNLEVYVNLSGAEGWREESEFVGRIDSVTGGIGVYLWNAWEKIA